MFRTLMASGIKLSIQACTQFLLKRKLFDFSSDNIRKYLAKLLPERIILYPHHSLYTSILLNSNVRMQVTVR
jgi:hypothetical protein